MTIDEVKAVIAGALLSAHRNLMGEHMFETDQKTREAERVLAALAAEGLVIGERAGLTEAEDQELARCIADADRNTLADPSFSALDDLLLIGLPKLGLALVRVVTT